MEHSWLYAVLVFGIIVLQGMDMAFVLASTLVDSRRSGAVAMAGSLYVAWMSSGPLRNAQALSSG